MVTQPGAFLRLLFQVKSLQSYDLPASMLHFQSLDEFPPPEIIGSNLPTLKPDEQRIAIAHDTKTVDAIIASEHVLTPDPDLLKPLSIKFFDDPIGGANQQAPTIFGDGQAGDAPAHNAVVFGHNFFFHINLFEISKTTDCKNCAPTFDEAHFGYVLGPWADFLGPSEKFILY
jgi:hypothetical protein